MAGELDLVKVRKDLEEARAHLAGRIGLRDEAYIEPTAETMESIQAAAARDLAVLNLDRWAHQLHLIEDALGKLQTGDYGICADCEEMIGAKRLQAVPWAQRCLKCQESLDESASAEYRVRAEPVRDAA